MKKIFMIAGEASGDQLGAGLLRAMASQMPCEIRGIGGERMQMEGLDSLFPMEEISLMGFAEIIPHVLRLKQRLRQAVQAIESFAPDMVVTIDSPGFNFRVVEALKSRGVVAPVFVHYVAPTVWAYKPQRARKTAALFHHLLVLLPFEPPYFEREGLATTFTGHPVADDVEAAFERRKGWELQEKKPVKIAVLAGSRKGEISRLLPVFRQTIARLRETQGAIELVIASTQAMEDTLRHAISAWGVTYRLVSDPLLKARSYYACDVALVKSGTITLEVAKSGLPMVVAYKVHALSAWLLRRMILTPYVTLINVLAGKEVIPERLQERCTATHLAEALEQLLSDESARRTQAEASFEAMLKLKNPQGIPASLCAAQTLIRLLEKTSNQ